MTAASASKHQVRYRIVFYRGGEPDAQERIIKASSGPEARIRFLNMTDIAFTPVVVKDVIALDGPEAEPQADPALVMAGKSKKEKASKPLTPAQAIKAAERRLANARECSAKLLAEGNYQRAAFQAQLAAQAKREIKALQAQIQAKEAADER